jgi:hypothetical protein
MGRSTGAAIRFDYLPFSFDSGFIASVVVALLVAAVDDPLGLDGLGAAELGDVELGVVPDDAVELGVFDISVDDDELLLVGGVAGIDGDVLLELLVGGVPGVVAVSLRCWQPAIAASTATAAAVIIKRVIMAPLFKWFGRKRYVVSRFGAKHGTCSSADASSPCRIRAYLDSAL